MADKFNWKTIYDKMAQKLKAKGFILEIEDNTPREFPNSRDIIEILSKGIADILNIDQSLSATLKAKSLKIGPSGIQKDMSCKGAKVKFDITTDQRFFTWLETFHTMLKTPYPEPGNGSPDVFATALKILLTQKPNSITGKIISGSDKVKATI